MEADVDVKLALGIAPAVDRHAYGLVSVGLTLIFGVMRIVNFAHGEFLMLGMFAAYWLVRLTGLHPYVVAVPAGLLLFAAGVATQRLLIDRVLGRADEAQILLTVGLSAFLQGGALFVWGADYRTNPSPLASASLALGPVYLSAGASRDLLQDANVRSAYLGLS